MTSLRIDLPRARAHWFRRTGLAAPVEAPLPELVAATGWLRTLGGADVYLAARARAPHMTRADLDAAVASHALRVVPAVRGCIYLVPAAHVALTARIAEGMWRPRAERDVDRAGGTWREIEQVADQVLAVLTKRAASTDAIRKALGTVRSYGERGKKVGLSSPVPVALRLLETSDRIERTLEDGRLDGEKYLWRVAARAKVRIPDDVVDQRAQLLAIVLGQAGPMTLAQMAEWSGLSQRDVKAALARLDAIPVTLDGGAREAWALARDRDAIEAAEAGDRTVALTFEDNYLVLHGGPGFAVAREFHGLEVEVWGSDKRTTLGEANHLALRSVVRGGQVIGFWELDGEAGVWAPLGGVDAKARKAADAAVEEAARFLIEEVGHGRSISVDTEADIARRAKVVKGMGKARRG